MLEAALLHKSRLRGSSVRLRKRCDFPDRAGGLAVFHNVRWRYFSGLLGQWREPGAAVYSLRQHDVQ
ncbi:hypothetical protein CBM2633_P370013 [Cupriavidus taiwanensis]|uniref:Uncharacterized protein n=1 Tax=Cupriavidus taiwanensis TaxID=164546 RepID=A0A375DAR5_9BURK|nr:hypothetical protein CBM2592_P390013 [Cupriavidus taiwanensis]SOY76402.1 hypothetical protein CBM2588_P410013 [Cupriavidus taiwanensis]SOY78055.1 hypothetical protein CBM2586_P380011 [Cupriavidus taiwanensis]SOZ02483.1 hypothetical protein CBM2600_P400013 [Cupriavidus taiwanensis]SOZ20882.1 hypothetical protein CBM2595_P380011 [Cupriavidus taiwanensis]